MSTINRPVLFADLQGQSLDAEDREVLAHPLVAGVTLFARNHHDPGQLRALCAALHGLREPPLLIAVDQEGGRVQRFRDGFTRLPAAAAIGALYTADPALGLAMAADVGEVMARELRACGVDLSFAPVLDVASVQSAVIGARALADDAATVAELALALATGMARGGLLAVGKHFPGHGGVALDSHLALPGDPRDLATITRVDLLPYRRLMQATTPHGAPLLGGVMTAHVVYAAVDAQPATFSRLWLDTILRARMGFAGTVFSDDLSMGGALGMGDAPDRVVAALEAGCDVALLCNDRAATVRVLDALSKAGPGSFAARDGRPATLAVASGAGLPGAGQQQADRVARFSARSVEGACQ